MSSLRKATALPPERTVKGERCRRLAMRNGLSGLLWRKPADCHRLDGGGLSVYHLYLDEYIIHLFANNVNFEY